ncbi:hypothetical protein chiPu_0003333 [Chiloscyllium punctatum]|uniref:Uncharacterized protein n=1 Tax=Chiloscyllium punctatum TaxID=137246 RepID=A0A401S3G2_CHIPU|nr:hypothetical protein [Chiloscyllium punctatum]
MEEAVDELINNIEKPTSEKPNFLDKLKKQIANEIEKCDCGYLARKENLKVVITVMTIIFILLVIANAIILFILFSKAKKTW